MYTKKQILEIVSHHFNDVNVQKALIYVLGIRTKNISVALEKINSISYNSKFIKKLTRESNIQLVKTILNNIDKRPYAEQLDINIALGKLEKKNYFLFRIMTLYFIHNYKKYEIAKLLGFQRTHFSSYLLISVYTFLKLYEVSRYV